MQYIGAVPESAKMEVIKVDQRSPNQNILINTDFNVNQRSYVSGASLAAGAYGFDRFRGHSSTAGSTHTLSGIETTIDHTTASTDGYLAQPVESGSLIVGREYTLSWKGSAPAVVWYAGGELEIPRTSPFTFVATQTYEIIYWYGDGVTVSEMKLEEGREASPWEKPDKATELTRCQRYFERIGYGVAWTPVGTGFAVNTTSVRGHIPFTQKRIVNSNITASSASHFRLRNPVLTPSALTFQYASKTGAEFIATTTGAVAGQGSFLQTNTAVAYIDVSAEL